MNDENLMQIITQYNDNLVKTSMKIKGTITEKEMMKQKLIYESSEELYTIIKGENNESSNNNTKQ